MLRSLLSALVAAALTLSVAPAARAADVSQTDEGARRIAELIGQLGDLDYFVRERAQEELAKLGFEAFDALEAAEFSDDIEIAARAKYLLRRMRVDWAIDGDPPLVRELLADYEQQSESSRLERIEQLVRLPDDAGLPAVCRLVRFERSPLLSKQAALKLLEQPAPATVDWLRRSETISQNLRRSVRPAAGWLRTFATASQNPSPAVEDWAKLVAQEETAQTQTPEETRPSFVVALLRRQVAALETLDRRDEAIEVMRKMIALETGESQSLTRLIGWLVEHRAWAALDELAQRFASQIESDPLLTYALAEARLAQGETAPAEELAARARAVNPADGVGHAEVASALQKRGLFDWAEAEYRYVINQAPWQPEAQRAASSLAEMLHDQQRELDAARTLEALVAVMDENAQPGNDRPNYREPAAVRSRMHYFHACHHEAAGERDRQIERLQQGIRQDPLDADVLIALYRLPNRKEKERGETSQLIKNAAEHFRNDIQLEGPDQFGAFNSYNQLAWLVGNSEGDYAEALACSEKSLELIDARIEQARADGSLEEARVEAILLDIRPGFLDTLGRCHYALGDYDAAVRFQSQAVALEPHSGQMARQLKLFQKTLEAKQSQTESESSPSQPESGPSQESRR